MTKNNDCHELMREAFNSNDFEFLQFVEAIECHYILTYIEEQFSESESERIDFNQGPWPKHSLMKSFNSGHEVVMVRRNLKTRGPCHFNVFKLSNKTRINFRQFLQSSFREEQLGYIILSPESKEEPKSRPDERLEIILLIIIAGIMIKFIFN